MSLVIEGENLQAMPDVQSHWILYLCIYSIKYLN